MGIKTVLILILTLSIHFNAKAEVWNIIADEWPPYACGSCPEGGAMVKALRKALNTVNVEIEVTYLPWGLVAKAMQSPKYVGYITWREGMFPNYFLTKKPVFISTLVFIELNTQPLRWKDLEDLKGKRIGLLTDLGYFPKATKLIQERVLVPVYSTTAHARILMLSQGKVDGVLIEKHLADYMMKQMTPEVSKNLRLNSKEVEQVGTYLAIRANMPDKVKLLDKALENVDTQKVIDEYIKAESFK